jgi:hypothetical protein
MVVTSDKPQPEFYLTTAGEYGLLSKPRACWFIQRMRDGNRDDYMLVRISPELLGQPFGLGNNNIDILLLATRHRGFSLYPVTQWPTSVYVTRLVNRDVLNDISFTSDQVELIAWGEIFPDLQEATSRAKQLEPKLL